MVLEKIIMYYKGSNKIIFRSVSSKILGPSAKSFFPYMLSESYYCVIYRVYRESSRRLTPRYAAMPLVWRPVWMSISKSS